MGDVVMINTTRRITPVLQYNLMLLPVTGSSKGNYLENDVWFRPERFGTFRPSVRARQTLELGTASKQFLMKGSV